MKPYRDAMTGAILGVLDGMECLALDSDRFLKWLESQNKTVDQWLAENPYKPWGTQTLEEHKAAKLLALNSALNAAVARRYDEPEKRMDQFKQLLARARFKMLQKPTSVKLQEAVAYMEALENWAMGGAQYIFATALAYFQQRPDWTHEDIEALSFDTEINSWLSQDQHWEVMVAAYLLAQGEAE